MKTKLFFLIVTFIVFSVLNFVSAITFVNDIYFSVPDTVFTTNERIELKGWVYQANYSDNGTLVSAKAGLSNAQVNLTVLGTNYSTNYTFTTDANGTFYSRSNFHTNTSIPQVNASSTPGIYNIRTSYRDPNGNTLFSQVEIIVINQSIDILEVSSEKATYNKLETLTINIAALKLIGDKTLYVSNISVNGSLRNSTKDSLRTFNCTTGINGKCSVRFALISSEDYGDYILELNDFKAFSSFSIVPFSYNLYMKDDLGEGYKNVFSKLGNEQARIEVKINNASISDSYYFSGYIADSSGNSVEEISTTSLTSSNSFTNSFLFNIDSTYNYGAYSAHVTVYKTGDGSISSITSFEVRDWTLKVNKKSSGSGFEYEYSAFSNQTLRFEALPTWKTNGSIIANISSSSFSINLRDELNNLISSTNASWNSSCGKSGCYEFSLTSPLNTGRYTLYTTFSYTTSYGGDARTDSNLINVINAVMNAQSTDKNGDIKELFGTTEYIYLPVSSYNLTSVSFNLSDAEIFLVSYMNGSEISYSQTNYSLVNLSNSVYEWGWNSSLQRIKMDIPKVGGIYNIYLFGNNRTIGATAKFIVNPYDVCTSTKTSAGTIDRTTSWYAWQFQTSDTIYFEIKLIQANNPTGRATSLNLSFSGTGNTSYGGGGACNVNTNVSQGVTNATITISEIKNLESGATQLINSSDSTCQANDNSGTYTCTLKPLSKWEGGQSLVKFNVQAQDGTSSIFYSRFEARAFYLYGWSQTWQNNPTSSITLQVYMYEAGRSWWYSGSGVNSGTITVKKVEYQGRDGEWFWPPVESGYNISAGNSSATTGSSGSATLTLNASNMPSGTWKTGYYRAVLQGTRTSGNTTETDYGYAWFSVRLWDVYGSPIDCTSNGCNYKNYFNSKENITLYIKISKAGVWDSGGSDIYGNVTIGVKKIDDCRKWPCKELNSSQYKSNTINVNASSPWYWDSGANLINNSKYILQINTTSGTWGTGYYSVILDINGTDTGYAWFNTIAFYVETQPTNLSGAYKSSIRGNQPMYFNVTVTKNYKWWNSYWNGSIYVYTRYNASDYINATLDSAVLRGWDQQTYQTKEYNYPSQINITPNNCSGNCLFNITYLNATGNATWPSGYYWGELTLKNSDNETSTGWLWFSVQPFRIYVYANNYNIDADQCVNASLSIYDPDWYSWTGLVGNYSITNIYENVWQGMNYNIYYYTNYTPTYFNNSASAYISICPNGTEWSGGNWGGWHYLNIVVQDTNVGDSQSGWLSFRAVPFSVSWSNMPSSSTGVITNANFDVTVSLTKPSNSSVSGIGNLTKLYQWRYDNYQSTREEYNYAVINSSGSTICYSSVSGQCTINRTVNITVYAPSTGWKVGWNYIYAEWTKNNDASSVIQDWNGIYFDGRAAYSGWFDNGWYDSNNNYLWKYYIALNENITIKLNVRDNNYNATDVSITKVEYAYSGDSCWSDWCRSYTTAPTWHNSSGGTRTSNGQAILNIKAPDSNWIKGYYAIRATVSGGVIISGGTVRVKDFTAPNITAITSPVNNVTYANSMPFSITTSENTNCYAYVVSYDNFHNWYCWNWNSTNSTNSSSVELTNACNSTKYNYNGSTYYSESVSNTWHSIYDSSNQSYCYNSGGSVSCWDYSSTIYSSRVLTFMFTGGTTHTYTFNVSAWPNQAYGLNIWCNDDDWNYVSALRAFRVNNIA